MDTTKLSLLMQQIILEMNCRIENNRLSLSLNKMDSTSLWPEVEKPTGGGP